MGSVVDEDPITGQRLTVTDAGSGTVTVASELAGLPATSTYDRDTGVLLTVSRTEASTGVTTSLQLASVQ